MRFFTFMIAGSKIAASPDQAFGPVLWTLYTLSNRVMKMTAQMPPVGEADNDTVQLQTQSGRGWKTVATARIDPLACTATFRVPDCRAAHKTLSERGAVFLTEPLERETEIRCFFRDPDGHLFEISESN